MIDAAWDHFRLLFERFIVFQRITEARFARAMRFGLHVTKGCALPTDFHVFMHCPLVAHLLFPAAGPCCFVAAAAVGFGRRRVQCPQRNKWNNNNSNNDNCNNNNNSSSSSSNNNNNGTKQRLQHKSGRACLDNINDKSSPNDNSPFLSGQPPKTSLLKSRAARPVGAPDGAPARRSARPPTGRAPERPPAGATARRSAARPPGRLSSPFLFR